MSERVIMLRVCRLVALVAVVYGARSHADDLPEHEADLLQQIVGKANAFSAWRHGASGGPAKQDALGMRQDALAMLKQLEKDSNLGSAEWAQLRFRRLAFAMDDEEVVSLTDVSHEYLKTIPVEVAMFRKLQIDAYLRMDKIREASQIAETCVAWSSNSALLEQIKAGGFDRGHFLQHVQDIGVNIIVKAPELNGSDEQRLDLVERVSSWNSSPQVKAAKSMAEHSIRNRDAPGATAGLPSSAKPCLKQLEPSHGTLRRRNLHSRTKGRAT